MSFELTLSILKPDVIEKKLSGKIITMFEENNFDIIAQKKVLLLPKEAEQFYYVHRERVFFRSLVDFMCSGPILVQVLKEKSAIQSYRTLIGSTDPKEAERGTIRNLYGESKERNAVHGSDSIDNAKHEISFFFSHKQLSSLCLTEEMQCCISQFLIR